MSCSVLVGRAELLGVGHDELEKLVGIVEITDCRELREIDGRTVAFRIDFAPAGSFAWLVKPIKRLAKPIAPKAHAQPSFFFPFG